MNDMLDIAISNAAAFAIELAVLLLLAQLLVFSVLRLSSRLLRWTGASQKFGDDWRSRVHGTTRLLLILLALVLVLGHAGLCFMRVRTLSVAASYVRSLGRSDLIALGIGAAKILGVALGAYLLSRVLHAIVGLVQSQLQLSPWLTARREQVDDLLERLRSLFRAGVTIGALLLVARIVHLPPLPQLLLWDLSYIVIGFQAGRFLGNAGDLAVDVGFALSDRLAKLDGPLRYVGSLAHLAPLTKRSVEYFVYVSMATWVSDQLNPAMWSSRAGRIAIRVIAIFFISRVLVELCTLFIHEFFVKEAKGLTSGEQQQRRTLAPVFTSFLRYAIYFASLIMVLREAGVDPTPLLAGAGILGVALGLGAQAFVRDIVAGFFILFENLFLVGDFIECAGVRGHVEEIGVRMSKIRDSSGILHAIPNGEIRTVSSHSKGWVTAVVDLRVALNVELEQVKPLLREAVAATRSSEPRVLGAVKIKVLKIEPGALVLRTKTPVTLGSDNEVGDMLRECMVKALQRAPLPSPDSLRVILTGDKPS